MEYIMNHLIPKEVKFIPTSRHNNIKKFHVCYVRELTIWNFSLYLAHGNFMCSNPKIRHWKVGASLVSDFILTKVFNLIIYLNYRGISIFLNDPNSPWQWFIKTNLGRTIVAFISCHHKFDESKLEFV